ncbi:hypothetical protein [Sphingobium sp.]|uniref:hypothetical protein n=1 Tax=Sphingobium sp. TaxID=1912891 RepID=UPI003BB6EC2B
MSSDPFGNLDDFGTDNATEAVPTGTIDKIAANSGFPNRKAGTATPRETASQTGQTPHPSPARQPRRHVTGRNRQINIKATEDTITELYRIADAMNLPLGAVLEQALAALAAQREERRIG